VSPRALTGDSCLDLILVRCFVRVLVFISSLRFFTPCRRVQFLPFYIPARGSEFPVAKHHFLVFVSLFDSGSSVQASSLGSPAFFLALDLSASPSFPLLIFGPLEISFAELVCRPRSAFPILVSRAYAGLSLVLFQWTLVL
jgi:hypothetical protein